MQELKENKIFIMPRRNEEDGEAQTIHEFLGSEQSEEKVKNLKLGSVASKLEDLAVHQIAIADIKLSPNQTREVSSESEVEGLAKSIKSQGIIQPLVVKGLSGEQSGFELIAGERRLRAAKLSGLLTVPCIIKNVNEQQAAEISVIENAQREDLNPIEEAQAYQILNNEFRMNQTQIAEVIGKNRSSISNSLRLLKLEPEVQELLKQGDLSAGHGRILASIDDPKLQLRLAHKVQKRDLSVRALEKLVQRQEEGVLDGEDEQERTSRIRAQNRVADYLGLEHVSLNFDSQGRRRLSLTFETEASWKRFIAKVRD